MGETGDLMSLSTPSRPRIVTNIARSGEHGARAGMGTLAAINVVKDAEREGRETQCEVSKSYRTVQAKHSAA